ncbi:MAG TPA: protein translocase subunit SecF [Methylomirabilota bacterium]|jgi:preprotein translocase subunit SecF|nr:protein translocase subunit SecF [Methylomirabilota bacterium]
MELIKPGTNFDFVRFFKYAYTFSLALILLGLASFWYHGGPNYGVDFAGGTVVHVKFSQPTNISDIRQALEATQIENITVQDFGQGGNEFLIRVPMAEQGMETLANQVQQGLTNKFGAHAFEIRRVETVGPKVGKDLRRKGLLAVLFSTIAIGVYIAFRFEPRFGVGAAIALLHDVLITAGALSLMNMEFDLTVVAALLTVVGFSVNDTVIICDRIRENMRKMRREGLAQIINRSVNETLSRTIITTGTAVLVILALFFLGGDVIHAFAFALLVGFTIGTYSSIYVASPIVLLWEKEGKRR